MGVKQTVLSIVIVALAALTTPSSAAAQQCSVPDPATFDFQPLITKWFPNPALYVLQQGMDGRAPKIVPSGQTVSNSQYETGTVVLENKLQDIAPERRTLDRLSICSDIAHNGSGYVFGVQHLFEAHVSSDAGHDPHLTPFEVLFKDSAAPDHHVIAVPAPTGSSLFCENRPSEEDDPSLFSCPDQIRLVALKRFYSQLLATWTQEFEEQLTQLHATQATYQAQQAAEENEEKSENRRAAQRHNAHAADLLAGRVPIKSCNDAAIKYKAQQGENRRARQADLLRICQLSCG